MLKESHDHLADRYSQKTGSPYQTFRRSQKPSPWLIFSTSVTVGVFLVLLFALPWEGGW